MESPVPPAEPSTLRRLVEREITTDEYVQSLDQRVQEAREDETTSPLSPRPESEPT